MRLPRLLFPILALTSILLGLALADLAQGRPQAAASQSGLCRITQTHSLVGKTKTTLRFVNQTKGRVRIDWLNYTGGRVFYKALAPGAGYTQSTWVTHPWVVLDSAGRCVGYVIAGKTRVYVIK